MKGKWSGPSGYVPELGNMVEGQDVEIVDQPLLRKLKEQGLFRPAPEEDAPRIPKSKKTGGE